MKKGIVLVMIIMLVTSVFVGCQGEEATTGKIDDDMMGYEDFFKKASSGDKVVVVYEELDNEMNNRMLAYRSKRSKEGLSNNLKNENFILKSDKDLTIEDLKERHIIVMGRPNKMDFFSDVADELPMKVSDGELIAGDKTFKQDKTLFSYITANPFNKGKYLVVGGAINEEEIEYTFPWINDKYSRNNHYMIAISHEEQYSDMFIKKEDSWQINKLGKNVGSKQKFETKESEHFIFHYDSIDNTVKDNIDKIIYDREKVFEFYTNELGYNFENKLDYYFFISKDLRNTYNDHRSGNWLEDIYEIYSEEEKLKGVYNKLIFDYIIRERVGISRSRFVETGLYYNVTYKNNQERIDSKNSIVKDMIANDEYIALEYLTGYNYPKDIDWEVYSPEMFSFSVYLGNKYGLDKFRKLYEVSLTKDMNESLYEVYGKDLLELEGEWIEYLNTLE